MYSPQAPWCKASVIILIYRQNNKSRRGVPIKHWTWGPEDSTSQTAKKRRIELPHWGWITQPLKLPPQGWWKRCPYACEWHLEDRRLRKCSGTYQVPDFNTCWTIQFLQNNETGSRSPCMRPRSDPPEMKNSTQTTRRISTLASRPSRRMWQAD